MKPVRLIARMLSNSARRGAAVLDPFGGSGSTLLACERLGMRARLIEIDPRYCDVTIRRWQEASGGKAVLEAGGTFEAIAANRARRPVRLRRRAASTTPRARAEARGTPPAAE